MSRSGFVYAIRCVASGWIKVGMTKSPNDRLRKLRHQEGGIALRMVRHWSVRNARKAEIAASISLEGLPDVPRTAAWRQRMTDTPTTILGRLWRWLAGPPKCPRCKLMRCEAADMDCCDWSRL